MALSLTRYGHLFSQCMVSTRIWEKGKTSAVLTTSGLLVYLYIMHYTFCNC